MTKHDWDIVERSCHRWLVLRSPEYRKAWLAACLVKHALHLIENSCQKPSTPSTPKTTTTPN